MKIKSIIRQIFLPVSGNSKWELLLIIYVAIFLFYGLNNYYIHGALYRELDFLSWQNEQWRDEKSISLSFIFVTSLIYFSITLLVSLLLFLSTYFDLSQSWQDIIRNHMYRTIILHLISISLVVLIIDSLKVLILKFDESAYYKGIYGNSGLIGFSESLILSFLIGHSIQLITLLFIGIGYKYRSKIREYLINLKRENKRIEVIGISPDEALRKINKLNELLKQGIINQMEYEESKNKIKEITDKNVKSL